MHDVLQLRTSHKLFRFTVLLTSNSYFVILDMFVSSFVRIRVTFDLHRFIHTCAPVKTNLGNTHIDHMWVLYLFIIRKLDVVMSNQDMLVSRLVLVAINIPNTASWLCHVKFYPLHTDMSIRIGSDRTIG